MTELIVKDIEIVTITKYHIDKKIGKISWIISRNKKDILQYPINLLEVKICLKWEIHWMGLIEDCILQEKRLVSLKEISRNYTQWNTDLSIYDTEMKMCVKEKGCTQMFIELHL